jgi:hypothetical protein
VLVVADDMGYSDLGCYGGEIATPTLDRLGRAGARLSRFYYGPTTLTRGERERRARGGGTGVLLHRRHHPGGGGIV